MSRRPDDSQNPASSRGIENPERDQELSQDLVQARDRALDRTLALDRDLDRDQAQDQERAQAQGRDQDQDHDRAQDQGRDQDQGPDQDQDQNWDRDQDRAQVQTWELDQDRAQKQVQEPAQAEALFDQLLRLLSGLKTQELRAQTLARELESLGSVLMAELTHLALHSARSHSRAADFVNALAHALERRLLDEEQVAQAREMARSRADRLSEAIFASGPPAREYDVNDEPFVDHQIRSLALGRRRSLSRIHDRFLLGRLVHDMDPVVIEQLMANPLVTETEALLVASRRPTRPEVLESVLNSRFSTSLRVRRAISQNPYSTVSLAVRAMLSLDSPSLKQVIRDGQVSEEVREHARTFLVSRGVRPAERHQAEAPQMPESDSQELNRLMARLESEVGDLELEVLDPEDED